MADLAVDVRALFNDLKIFYRDRGPNTARGNLSIKCPLCADDPSQHMLVSEQGRGYYCLRDRRHKGRDMVWLLTKLGFERYTAAAAVSSAAGQPLAPPAARPRTPLEAAWNRLELASADVRCRAYLTKRGYDPERTSKLYDLRSQKYGVASCRVYFPCWVNNVLEGYTGRAIYDHLDPRYLMTKAAPDEDRALYMPRGVQPTMIIVEGPFDALRLAVAYEGTSIGSVALLGLKPAMGMRALAGLCVGMFSAYDSGVTAVQTAALNAELAYLVGLRYIYRIKLPEGIKDVDELSNDNARQWFDTAMAVAGTV